MVRHILKWTDTKMEDTRDDNMAVGCTKAFGLGAVEGLVNACTIVGGVVLANSVIATIAGAFRKK